MKRIFNINTILILSVLVIGVIGMFFTSFNKSSGSTAIVDVNSPKQRLEIDLSRNETYKIDANLPVTLQVKDNAITFINSECPDKKCEGYGYIHIEDAQAICLPAGVVVTIHEVKK